MTGLTQENLLADQLKAYWLCIRTAARIPRSLESGLFCPATFDGFGCWDATSAGHTTSIPCPDLVKGSNKSQVATRRCLKNGSWESFPSFGKDMSDYSHCSFDIALDAGHSELLAHILRDFSAFDESPYSDIRVGKAFDDCVDNTLSKPPYLTGTSHCPRTFDGWGCWNDTPAGHIGYTRCPSFIPGLSPERLAFKVCNPDGTWYRHPDTNKTWSNYTTCVDDDDLRFRQQINGLYIAGYSVSVVALLLALFIFTYFKCLQCTRVSIHKNLFVSFIVNNIMWIVWYTEVVQHPDILFKNELPCQVLHVVLHYFLLCNYFWMFCEGLHLHTLMVVAFVQERNVIKWFYVVGWGVPVILILIYAVSRGTHEDHTDYCWIEESSYLWIISGPVCLSMLVNLVFLVNIVRVLVTKMRAMNVRETNQTGKAVRATLILLPLLGLHYIITPFRPEPKSRGETVYETISAIVASFQGLSVALLFCFFNGEVVTLMRNSWRQKQPQQVNDKRVSYATVTFSLRPSFRKTSINPVVLVGPVGV